MPQQPPVSVPAFPVFSERNVESRGPCTPERRQGLTPEYNVGQASALYGSPGFGNSVPATQNVPASMEGLTPRPEAQPRSGITPRIPPEDHVTKGCSLFSMEPLGEWFCKGADMTSPAEHEAALTLCQLEQDPPHIRLYNDNIREEKRTHLSLEGVKFPTLTVDVIQRGEALAIFERI